MSGPSDFPLSEIPHESHHWLPGLWAYMLVTDWSVPSPKIHFLYFCLTGICSLFLGNHYYVVSLLITMTALLKKIRKKFLESSWLLSFLWDLVFRYCFSIQSRCLIYRQCVYTPVEIVNLCSWCFGLVVLFLILTAFQASSCALSEIQKMIESFGSSAQNSLKCSFLVLKFNSKIEVCAARRKGVSSVLSVPFKSTSMKSNIELVGNDQTMVHKSNWWILMEIRKVSLSCCQKLL